MRHNSLSGIGNITVEKNALIDILTQNRDKHHEIFEEAVVQFRERAIERLDSLIETLRQKKLPDSLVVGLPIPEEHTDDYNRAIQMLQMHTGETVSLTEQAYMQLVDDEWGWRDAFVSNTYAYTAAANNHV